MTRIEKVPFGWVVRRARAAMTLAFALPFGACTVLPDVTPFATATADMAAEVRAAGPAVAGELARTSNGDALSARLSASWDARDAAMDGVVRYADALAAVVGASADRGQAVANVAQNLGALAAAAGYPLPASTAGVAGDAARFVWAQIEIVKSADSLEKALAAAQPVVDRLAEKLGADFQDLSVALRAATESERADMQSDPVYNAGAGVRESLAAAKRAAIESLAASAAGGADDAPSSAAMERLARLDALIASNEAQLAPLDAKLQQIDERERGAQSVLAASSAAIQRWAIAHRDLAAAVAARRSVDVDSLVAAIVEIRDLIKKAGEP